MPELPEVEIVRRGLEPVLVGRRFARVSRRRADLRFPLPEHFTERLEGRRVLGLDRRGKYLLARLAGDEALVMHLGMTGRFTVAMARGDRETAFGEPATVLGSPPPSLPRKGGGTASSTWLAGSSPIAGALLFGDEIPLPSRDAVPPPLRGRLGGGEPKTVAYQVAQTIAPTRTDDPAPGESTRLGRFAHDTGRAGKHDHIVFVTDADTVITYNDPRRFGFMLLIADTEFASHPLFRGLGPEPLGAAFDAVYLASRAHGRSADLKTFLMDQRVAAGLGNIYVAEALHRAGLSPNRRAGSLARANGQPTDRARRLVAAIRVVLDEAIIAGGSTLRDYRRANGELGTFQHSFRVYGRDGSSCARPGCAGVVRRVVHAGRATFFCGTCQR